MGVGFIVAGIVGAVMLFAHPRHQRVGDLLAATFVVRTRDVGRPTTPGGAPTAGISPDVIG